ncbi:hypothetical protein B9Z19DRAFT_1067187 [Tuber borchii]|uniref:Uncharacterized protein n=1 Tax=Tuber borchii TaxID=42251 RepID=A0A2T6ZJY3_TUBBO|nr:hypothetical protein B9Z19DRAFT_1067187 [Tuber borchii]
MDPIPELNLPGLSPTAARAFASDRFASDGGLIPDGTPREIYMYHPRDFQDENRELIFRRRILHYFKGKSFVECIPCMIWLLNNWSKEFGTFCLDWANTFITGLGPGYFDNLRFQAPQDVTSWDEVANPTISKPSKRKTSAGNNTKTNANTEAPLPNPKLATLWCKINVRHLVRRLEVCYAPRIYTFSKWTTSGTSRNQYYDPPLHPVPSLEERLCFWTERETMYVLKDMREAAKKISAKEFVHLDVQTLLKKTDINSLVDRYFYLLDKGEFKFMERVGARGNVLGGFV